MKINPKYLKGSTNKSRRAQLIRQIAEIYKKGKPYPSNLDALMKERDKLQAGGNPYAMPTSAATSGYTSNMSGMAGANQAALQLQQLQQEVMQNQQMQAQQAEQRDLNQQAQFEQDIQQQAGKLATEENAEQLQKALGKRASRRAAKKLAKQGVESAATGNAAILAQANQAAPIMMDSAQTAGRALTMGDDMLGMGQQVVGAPVTNSLATGVTTGSQVAGKVATTAAKRAAATNAAGPIGAGMSIIGTGVEHFSDDKDDTRTNFGEGSGRALKGAGTAVGLAGTLGTLAPALALGPLGLVAAGVVGGGAALLKQRKQKMEARKEAARQQAQDAQIASAEDAAFKQSMLTTGQDMGYNIGSSMTNSYLPGYQMQAGGTITPDDPKIQAATAISRYSDKVDPATSRYLDRVDPNRLGMSLQYDNTLEAGLFGAADLGRAIGRKGVKAGVDLITKGKKIPTAASRSRVPSPPPAGAKVSADGKNILIGDSKISTISPEGKKMLDVLNKPMYQKNYPNGMQTGGYMKPLPGGAVEFVGPKHSQGGIMLDPQTEVEGGETMDKVKMKENGGKSGDYIFSDFLKLGKKTFAQRHKEMLGRGATQGDIQKLAKMQEEVAKREGRDENGPRGPERIMRAGGVKKHQSGDEVAGVIPSPDAIDQYELDPENAYARDFPEGQSRTEEGLYRRADGDPVTMEEVEALKSNNPWYNKWDEFDPTDPKDVEAFQTAYNERVPEASQIKVDGKVGEQTVTAYIPYKRGAVETEAPTVETPEETPEETSEETPMGSGMNLRKDILLPYQLIGPMAELTTKYPQPNKIAAPVTGRIKMPRINMNAERASLAASTNAANKFIQNQSAGPAAIAAQMAMGEKQRQGNIDIATQEARQNKDRASTEAIANLRASQFDATNVSQARQFNALAQNQRDQNEYEKRMLAYNQLGTNLAQYDNDVRAYKTEDRIAEASQIAGEYTRQKYLEELRRKSKRKKSEYYGMNDTQLREVAAQMVQGAPTYNQQDQQRVQAVVGAANAVQGNTEQPAQQKRGGYLRKMGKIKRRKK